MVQVFCAALVIAGIFVGLRARLFTMTAMFVRLVLCLVLAQTFAEQAAVFSRRFIAGVSFDFLLCGAFILIAGGSYFIFTVACLRWLNTDGVVFPMSLDRLGGGIIGAACGFVVAGAVMIAWSMAASFLPIKPPIAESDPRFDPGCVLLREFGRLHRTMPGRRAFEPDDAVEKYRRSGEAARPTDAASLSPVGRDRTAAHAAPKPFIEEVG